MIQRFPILVWRPCTILGNPTPLLVILLTYRKWQWSPFNLYFMAGLGLSQRISFRLAWHSSLLDPLTHPPGPPPDLPTHPPGPPPPGHPQPSLHQLGQLKCQLKLFVHRLEGVLQTLVLILAFPVPVMIFSLQRWCQARNRTLYRLPLSAPTPSACKLCKYIWTKKSFRCPMFYWSNLFTEGPMWVAVLSTDMEVRITNSSWIILSPHHSNSNDYCAVYQLSGDQTLTSVCLTTDVSDIGDNAFSGSSITAIFAPSWE